MCATKEFASPCTGLTPDRRDWYFVKKGFTPRSEQKAPFLNSRILKPFVVAPSGKMQSGVASLFSHLI